MKAKTISFVLIFVVLTSGAFSQTLPFDTTGKRSTVPPAGVDTSKWSAFIVHKTSDTVKENHPGQTTPIVKPKPKTDKRWFISPLLKLQAQDFGMLEKQRKGYLSDAETLSFVEKTNRSAAVSAYKNLGGHFSAGIDLGMSVGHVANKDTLVSKTQSRSYALGAANLYFNLLGNQFKLQPFLAAGISGIFNKQVFLSAPVGMGVKYSSKKIMVLGEAAYGYSMSPNIANTLMYSVGIYIPIKSKKQKEEEAEEARKKDTGIIRVTNITNNYYYYNHDSARQVQDSLLTEIHNQKVKQQEEVLHRDIDDPMNLPNAQKHIVYFYYDQYALTTNAFGVVDRVIQKMKENPKLSVHLKGHTDMSGSEQYNAPLSKKRAQMVFDYMNSRGISADRMILSGYGKKKPAVQNEDPNTAWMNRRVEMVLFEKN